MMDDLTPEAEPAINGSDLTSHANSEKESARTAATQTERSAFRYAFFGADGLRAGWSVLLFITIAVLVVKAVTLIVTRIGHIRLPAPGAEFSAGFTLLTEGPIVAVLLLAAWIVSRVEKRAFYCYGLGSPLPRLKQFAAGWLWGFLLLSLLVGLLWTTGALVFNGKLLAGVDIFRWGAVWLFTFLCVSLLEEFLTRGFLQFTLTRGLAGLTGALGLQLRSRKLLSFWIIALFFSFVFGLGHSNNPGESPIGLASAGLIGLVFAFSLWRTGSLWWAIGYHAAWDWAQSFIYGVRDSGMLVQHHLLASHPEGSSLISGGLTGPEGSIYILGVCAVTTVIVALTLRSQPGSPSDPAYLPGKR